MSSSASETAVHLVPPLSLRALGKRPLEATPAGPTSSAKPGGLVKVVEQEKRITRSSQSDSGSVDDGSATPAFLPPNTLVLLVAVAPTSLTYFPPLTLEESGASQGLLEKPSFRLLGTGDGYGRSRNTGRAEVVDTSDEYYHRLHRFPEILEKRSAKAERERLIHERSKLILEIEDMRGRGWVYSGDQGGRGEVDRKRKLKEAEERLARYDALLPNQPRKSGFLNGTTSHQPGSASTSRATSPTTTRREQRDASRHSTPVSASGDGGTRIKIVFRGSANPVQAKDRLVLRNTVRRTTYTELTDDDLADDLYSDLSAVSSPRDVNPVVMLPLPPPPPKRKPTTTIRVRSGRVKRVDAMMERDSEEEIDYDEDEETDGVGRDGLSKPSDAYLISTFYRSETLRESVALAAKTKSTRRSLRVAYAFGHRLPEKALVKTKPFELFGGVADDDIAVPLDDLVRAREGCGGGNNYGVIVQGISVPSSALVASAYGPLVSR